MKFINRYKLEVLVPTKGEKWDVQKEHPETGELVNYIITDVLENHNDVVDDGANLLLDVMFNDGTKSTLWYLGLVNNSGFSAFDTTDAMDSHAGWTEFTGYTETGRQSWDPAAASSRAIVNGTTVDFTMNTSATLRGAFAVDDDGTGSSTTGNLWATMEFSTPKSVDSGTVLRLTYTVEVS